MVSKLAVCQTNIPGLYEIDLVIHGDERGWFKETYQKAKMEALGLPTFEIVQNNFSFNAERGVTRGLHAEPWEKFISVAYGKVYGVWVDLRRGKSFGTTYTSEITPAKAVFVPRGVANGYQTLNENTTYTYLVNDYWSPDVQYVAVNPFDPELSIQWPISQERAIVSSKDRLNPQFKIIAPMEF